MMIIILKKEKKSFRGKTLTFVAPWLKVSLIPDCFSSVRLCVSVCVCVCVCVLSPINSRVCSVSSVCVWRGASAREWTRELKSGWNPRSLVSSLRNQISKEKKNKCEEQERVCDHIQQLFYVFVSQSVGDFFISFNKNKKTLIRTAVLC